MSEKYDRDGVDGEKTLITGLDGVITEQRIDAEGRCVAQATFSVDRVHRWTLGRIVSHVGVGRVLFVMCNPSTADAFALDPTVGRCAKFARSWGYESFEVVNLFSRRSPYPKDLIPHIGNIEEAGTGLRNNVAINHARDAADLIVCAWGAISITRSYNRARSVRDMLRDGELRKRDLFHLGLTSDGYPKHPLARGKAAILTTQEPIRWQ